MTATAPQTRAARAARASSPYRLSFARVLRSEWIKITTIRSTWWSLGVAAVLSIGISLLVAGASSSFATGFDAINAIVSPMQFTMLVAGILGSIVVTGEYSTGMIRSTLTAEPHRGVVIAAKAVVVGLLMAATTIVIYAIAIVVTAPLLRTQIDWSSPEHSVIPLAYGVLSMVVFTLMGLSFGFVIRNGAGAIATTVGILFVLPIAFGLFSLAGEGWRWLVDLGQYLPSTAAQSLIAPGGDVLPSLLALVGWFVVPLAAGWAILRTRDA